MAERPRNLCVDPPPFTLKTLRDAIPAHCFKRSLPTSLMHLASDLALVASFFYLATWIDSYEALPVWSKYVLWPIYWGAQGSVLTGRQCYLLNKLNTLCSVQILFNLSILYFISILMYCLLALSFRRVGPGSRVRPSGLF